MNSILVLFISIMGTSNRVSYSCSAEDDKGHRRGTTQIRFFNEDTAKVQLLCKANQNSGHFDGICIPLKDINDCPNLEELLRNYRFPELAAVVCTLGNNRNNLKVCCPVEDYKRNRSRNEYFPDLSQHPSFHLFQRNHCGKRNLQTRIKNGKNAIPGEFPWVVRLGLKDELDEQNITFGCGGTLINERYVLTAAHCFRYITEENMINRVIIRLGETDAEINPENYTVSGAVVSEESYVDVTISLNDIIAHPGYDFNDVVKHDLALIRLSQPMNISSVIKPICLPFWTEYQVVGDDELSTSDHSKLEVAGWGLTTEGKPTSLLQFANINHKPMEVCQTYYWGHRLNLTDPLICAGGDDGQNACRGDSGGPLSVDSRMPKKPKNGIQVPRSFLVGIVSMGKKECDDAPTIYTRVRSYLMWILDTVKP